MTTITIRRVLSLLLLSTTLFGVCAADEGELLTRAERSGFTETSRYGEILEMLHLLEEQSPHVRVEIFGTSAEGRPLPLVVLGAPPPDCPEEVDRGRSTVLFIQANIHAGEVDGKEAALMLIRDLVGLRRDSDADHDHEAGEVLDNTVLLIAPDFNADGNEKISTENRRWQNGPFGGVGLRANAQNLDLNRDYIKLETPEVQAHMEQIVLRWDPHVLVDCHTTNGSLHTEPITYSFGHNPLGDLEIQEFDRKVLLPWVAGETERREGYTAIPYGNWVNRRDPLEGWRTFGHEPRYATNYWGLRNRHAVLIEIYAYADFETRVRSCRAFLRSIVEFVHRRGNEVRSLVDAADHKGEIGARGPVTFRFERVATEEPVEIESYGPEVRKPPHLTPGIDAEALKTVTYRVPFYALFEPAGPGRNLPERGYLVPRGHVRLVEQLRRHGIRLAEIVEEGTAEVEIFEITEIVAAERLFQGHRTHRLQGSWARRERSIPAGGILVPTKQPQIMLAAYLLEPQSDDGMAFWNVMDSYLTKGTFDASPAPYPVWRW